jgi:hypothetical protein
MVALSDIPAITMLNAQLSQNNRALQMLEAGPAVFTQMTIAPVAPEGQQFTMGGVSFDTTQFPGMETLQPMMIDIINWRNYLIKEALQGLGVDVAPITPAETAAHKAHPTAAAPAAAAQPHPQGRSRR